MSKNQFDENDKTRKSVSNEEATGGQNNWPGDDDIEVINVYYGGPELNPQEIAMLAHFAIQESERQFREKLRQNGQKFGMMTFTAKGSVLQNETINFFDHGAGFHFVANEKQGPICAVPKEGMKKAYGRDEEHTLEWLYVINTVVNTILGTMKHEPETTELEIDIKIKGASAKLVARPLVKHSESHMNQAFYVATISEIMYQVERALEMPGSTLNSIVSQIMSLDVTVLTEEETSD